MVIIEGADEPFAGYGAVEERNDPVPAVEAGSGGESGNQALMERAPVA